MAEDNEFKFTQADLDEKLSYWKKVLKLQDWWIEAAICRCQDMGDEKTAGEVDVKMPFRMAKIWLRDPMDYSERRWVPIDLERVLVHELLHIHFESLWTKERDTSCHIPEEQVINAITDALIELERKNG